MATREQTITRARRYATQLQDIIDAEEADKFQARQTLGRLANAGITSGRQYDAAMAELTESRQVIAETQAKLDAIQKRIASILFPPGTEPPPVRPPPSGGPPPSTGKTVDPAALEAAILSKPRTSLQNEWGFPLTWKAGDPDMADTRFSVTKGLAVLNHGGTGTGGIQAKLQPQHVASNLELDGLGKIRWGAMLYGVPEVWDGIYFHDIKEEHSDYNKSCWDSKLTNCLAKRVGSQFWQHVSRIQEMVNYSDIWSPYGTGRPSEVLIENCALMDVGLPTGARPGYAIWGSEPQGIPGWTHILRNHTIRGCHIETWEHPNYQASGGLAYSFGAIALHCQANVAVLDTRVLMGMPDRSVIQLWDNDEVWIIGGEVNDYWYGKTLDLDIRGRPGTKVHVVDLAGDWRARICGGSFWDYAYKFQDQEIAPFLKKTHHSKTDGQSFEFVIPS